MKKTPPHDLQLEQTILACVIQDNTVFDACLKLKPDDFYRTAHRIIFLAMLELYGSETGIDLVSLTEYLKEKSKLADVGAVYLAELITEIHNIANIKYYVEKLREYSIKRKILKYALKLEHTCDDGYTLNEIISNVQKQYNDILSVTHRDDGLKSSDDIIHEIVEQFENPSKYAGILSSISSLNNLIKGFQKGHLYILAARPSVGKTALSLQFAEYASAKLKNKVAFFTLEMSRREILTRFMQITAHENIDVLYKDKQRFEKILNSTKNSPFWVDDTADLTIYDIKARCKKLKNSYGLDMVIIDYLQLITPTQLKVNRNNQVSEISRNCKILARELEIPVIALSQLNRENDKHNRAPLLSDLRDSGAIEQDADVVMFLHRKKDGGLIKADGELIVAKHRNGKIGKLDIYFVGKSMSFEEKTFYKEASYE